jgi:phosphate transport system substrate-binding protein
MAAAAATIQNMPADFRVSITASPCKESYPISSLTWLLVPVHMPDKAKGGALKAFLAWGLSDGQKLGESLSYARAPQNVVEKELQAMKLLQY